MIIETFEQYSEEWWRSRCGVPSASNFCKIITTKGEPSKQAKTYLYKLAGEAITGKAEETYTNGHMERGTALEPDARALYEMVTGDSVKQVGMCFRDDNKSYLCSPDGLIDGKTKGLEIKCPSMAVHIEYLLGNKLPTDYFQQVHGSMLVTDFPEWDFMSYYPGLPPLIITVKRDDVFNGQLSDALNRFVGELESVKSKIKAIQG